MPTTPPSAQGPGRRSRAARRQQEATTERLTAALDAAGAWGDRGASEHEYVAALEGRAS